jgi:hypothetical protein
MPRPTRTPTALRDADFSLDVSVPLLHRAPEPIALEALLTYSGPQEEITVWGPSSGLASYEFQQNGSDLYMAAFLGGSCVPYALRRNVALPLPLIKSSGWEVGDSSDPFYQSWLADPEVHLPLGSWRLNVQVEFVDSPDRPCGWQSGQISDEKQLVRLIALKTIYVVPHEPLAEPAEGCVNDFRSPYAQIPDSVTVGGETQLRVTNFDGWLWRTGGGGRIEIDYEVDLPPKPLVPRRGTSIGIVVGAGYQLINGSATVYDADLYLTDEHGSVVSTGDPIGSADVSFRNSRRLDVGVPRRAGSWVISVRVTWLTPCLIGNGEVTFSVTTR